MSAGALPIPAVLATIVCPNCSYSLAGLVSAGICPECGRAYDQSAVILYGFARGRHENVSNAKGSKIIWSLGIPLAYLWLSFNARRTNPTSFYIFFGMTALPVVYALFRRFNTEHPGLIQIRLNEQGCVQYDDLAGYSVVRELFLFYGWAISALGAVTIFIGWRAKSVEPIYFWILFPMFVGGSVMSAILARHFRRAMRNVPQGSVIDLNAVWSKPVPWDKIKDFSLKPAKTGTYRLRINGFSKFVGNDEVDAEITLTLEQATALDDVLNLWLAIARKQPSPA